jgi:hypothetical protein
MMGVLKDLIVKEGKFWQVLKRYVVVKRMNFIQFLFVSQEVFKHSWLIQDYWACLGYWVGILWSLKNLIPNKHLASTHWVYSQEIERKKMM